MKTEEWRHVIDCLRADAVELQKSRQRQDVYRGRALLRAYQALVRIPPPGTDADLDALDPIPGIGPGTIERLRSYIHNGFACPSHPASSDPTEKANANANANANGTAPDLSDIYGLGPKRQTELKEQGIRTRAQLREALWNRTIALPDATVRYLEHADDLAERIPRSESVHFREIVQTALEPVPGIRWDLAGSFRRGLATQGDWDVLVSSRRGNFAPVLRALRKHLELVELGMGPVKWEGLARLPGGKMRRLDLRMLPPESYGAALLYFTGSKDHNLFMRQKAKQMGFKLNEYGLYRIDDPAHPVAGATEEDIFKMLRMPFVPPERRMG